LKIRQVLAPINLKKLKCMVHNNSTGYF